VKNESHRSFTLWSKLVAEVEVSFDNMQYLLDRFILNVHCFDALSGDVIKQLLL